MTELYDREATVQVDTIVLSGLRVSFKVERTLRRHPNKAEIKIWNLNPDHRSQLEQLRSVPCRIDAGYVKDTSTLFIGDLRRARSAKDGPNWITSLESGDGEVAMRTRRVSRSFGANTSVEAVLRHAASALGVDPGNSNIALVGAALGRGVRAFAHGTVLDGNAANELDRIASAAGLEWSVQNGALQILPRGQPLATEAIVLTPSTGLLGTPTLDNKGVMKARCKIIHNVEPGRVVNITSSSVTGAFRLDKTIATGDTHGADWFVDLEGRAF